jgi:general stress protein YciG
MANDYPKDQKEKTDAQPSSQQPQQPQQPEASQGKIQQSSLPPNSDEETERSQAQGPAPSETVGTANISGEGSHRGARGTAAMDPGTRREVARKGGLAVSRNREHMAEIGRKGGQSVSRNREHMARIGRKGGTASRGSGQT